MRWRPPPSLPSKTLAVDRVFICTPDKDLSQCVRGTRVVQLDRRKNFIRDEAGVFAKFGVEPASIPDYLALVGDAADGYPGLAGWGAKSASKVLARYRHIESIPESWRDWGVDVDQPFRIVGDRFGETMNVLFCFVIWRRFESTYRCSSP